MSRAAVQRIDRSSRPVTLDSAARLRCNLIYSKIRKTLEHRSPTEFFADPKNSPDSELLQNYFANQARGMRKFVAHHRAQSKLNFDRPDVLIVYDRLYFYRNLYKCLIACEVLIKTYPDLAALPYVIDIGSGVGTFGLALAIVAREILHKRNKEVVLVDRAPFQLKLGELLFDILKAGEPIALLRDVVFQGGDIFTDRADDWRAIRLCSYVFGGKRRALEEMSDKNFASIFGPTCIVIDYKNTLDLIEMRARSLTCKTFRYSVSASIPASYISEVRSLKLTANILIIRAPS